MPFDFTTPSGLIPKGSAFWGSVVFAKQGGAWGQGSEEGRDTSTRPPPLKKGNSKGPLNFLGGISRKLIGYNTSTILIHHSFTGLVGLT